MTKIDKHAGKINVVLVARFRKVPQALGRDTGTSMLAKCAPRNEDRHSHPWI
jgi:hypothetical protein